MTSVKLSDRICGRKLIRSCVTRATGLIPSQQTPEKWHECSREQNTSESAVKPAEETFTKPHIYKVLRRSVHSQTYKAGRRSQRTNPIQTPLLSPLHIKTSCPSHGWAVEPGLVAGQPRTNLFISSWAQMWKDNSCFSLLMFRLNYFQRWTQSKGAYIKLHRLWCLGRMQMESPEDSLAALIRPGGPGRQGTGARWVN